LKLIVQHVQPLIKKKASLQNYIHNSRRVFKIVFLLHRFTQFFPIKKGTGLRTQQTKPYESKSRKEKKINVMKNFTNATIFSLPAC